MVVSTNLEIKTRLQ